MKILEITPKSQIEYEMPVIFWSAFQALRSRRMIKTIAELAKHLPYIKKVREVPLSNSRNFGNFDAMYIDEVVKCPEPNVIDRKEGFYRDN